MKKFSLFQEAISQQKKLLVVLIDPDQCKDEKQMGVFIKHCNEAKIDCFFVGGSFLSSGDLKNTIQLIKINSTLPILIFPGDSSQICSDADGILLLSLVSGRNADLLIGQHVGAAFTLERSGLAIIPTGYLLIESGATTTAQYVSGTTPIPRTKADIAAATSLASQQLGMHVIYLDGGSGALLTVPPDMIRAVKKSCALPLIVGGGIQSLEEAQNAWNAGADIVVIGTLFEKNPDAIHSFKNRK